MPKIAFAAVEKPGQFGANLRERLYNVALELTLTWINHPLPQIVGSPAHRSYHKGDKGYAFLNGEKIKVDDLNGLFFQGAGQKAQRKREQMWKYAFDKVPYLNSSLFEPAELEQTTLFISNARWPHHTHLWANS